MDDSEKMSAPVGASLDENLRGAKVRTVSRSVAAVHCKLCRGDHVPALGGIRIGHPCEWRPRSLRAVDDSEKQMILTGLPPERK